MRTIIIDDEPIAINVLALLLKKKCKDDVEVIATSNSPIEGKELIEKLSPDLVFLDIEMPGISGIDLLRSFPNPSFASLLLLHQPVRRAQKNGSVICMSCPAQA